jgi:hypothetical protein
MVVATGMWKPYIPLVKGMHLAEGYEDFSLDPKDYEQKAVLILGMRNSLSLSPNKVQFNSIQFNFLSLSL